MSINDTNKEAKAREIAQKAYLKSQNLEHTRENEEMNGLDGEITLLDKTGHYITVKHVNLIGAWIMVINTQDLSIEALEVR